MSTEYTRYFSALVDYNAGNPIDDRDLDGEFDAITVALNRKVLCANSAPLSPINGQTWIDTTNKFMKVYRNNEWVIITAVHVGTAVMATPQEGDLWYDTTNNMLKSYDGANWISHSGVPTGSIHMWSTDTAPSGYLLCYGQAVSRETYAALYAVIGTTFGIGDGSTTFNIPDLRGRFPLGKDNMGGASANRVTDSDADTIGGNDGDEFKNLAHTHNVPATSAAWGSPGACSASQKLAVASGGGDEASPAATSDASTGSGGSATQDIMPPFITLNFIIKS